ncbi:MAG: response regulator, partial [Nitrospirota bacterium]|nr:response regulator [Nitrospirota bacterium]
MRILVVEDDPSVSGFILKGLREEHYAVDLAIDGEAGLSMVDLTTYDLILLDVMLPKVNGFEVCQRLRAARNTTPILLLTARETVEDRVLGLDTGADDYLTKPFAFPELLARIRALLRRGQASAPTQLTIADLDLDPVTHKVW